MIEKAANKKAATESQLLAKAGHGKITARLQGSCSNSKRSALLSRFPRSAPPKVEPWYESLGFSKIFLLISKSKAGGGMS
jgi:hypothetical protein